MKRKVTDLNENEVIHCNTEQEAISICKLMHEAGLKWMNLKSSYLESNLWTDERHCYRPLAGTWDMLENYESCGYKIYPASDFLEPTLSEKIEELKEFAKSQGMKCEVVVSEIPKRIEVDCGWTTKKIGRSKNQVVFCFDKKGTGDNIFVGIHDTSKIADVTKFLSKQLESYLNGEIGKDSTND